VLELTFPNTFPCSHNDALDIITSLLSTLSMKYFIYLSCYFVLTPSNDFIFCNSFSTSFFLNWGKCIFWLSFTYTFRSEEEIALSRVDVMCESFYFLDSSAECRSPTY